MHMHTILHRFRYHAMLVLMNSTIDHINTPPPYRFLAGHCFDVLKTMPASTIDCCVTSPPYWRLRDYQTENKMWDDDPRCIHNWNRANIRDSRAGSFCIRCGAWQGSLGLEPN